jgi:cobalt-zinc-cadmium efflux system membrane fusion protein
MCAEHAVPEAECPFCNSERVEALGMCGEHGIPEALCFACHPDLAPAFQAEKDWCAEHERPESQCWLCHPDRDPSRRQAAADLPPGDIALEQAPVAVPAGAPRSRRPPTASCTKQDLRVRFATAEVAASIGLEYARAETRRITQTIECNATLEHDRNRHAQLSAAAAGRVETVEVDLGDRVAAGQVLAVLSAPEVGSAKASLIASRAALDLWERSAARERDLLERGVSTERDALEATSSLAEARSAAARAAEELRRLGLTAQQVEEVAETGDTSPRLPLLAPFAGIVVDRFASAGEAAEPGQPVLAVADASRVWALLDVWESDVPLVRAGQPVVVSLDALPGETFGGRLSWVAERVDPVTRTLAARAVLANPDGRLKAQLFGRAHVYVRESQAAVVVPQDAVQWEGCCNVVFVRRDDTLFEPRKVLLGTSTGAVYEVLDGLAPGDVVVTKGAFLLKTELLKGSIGAGCCDAVAGA